jgi:hypothetical protein
LLEAVDVAAKSVQESNWRKCPDEPLAKVVRRKLERRVRKGINATVKKTLVKKD